MEKLKRLQKKLSASGYNAEFITVYNRNGSGENVPALRIITDYKGQYPPKETYAAISDIKKLCKNHVTECRGFLPPYLFINQPPQRMPAGPISAAVFAFQTLTGQP